MEEPRKPYLEYAFTCAFWSLIILLHLKEKIMDDYDGVVRQNLKNQKPFSIEM